MLTRRRFTSTGPGDYLDFEAALGGEVDDAAGRARVGEFLEKFRAFA